MTRSPLLAAPYGVPLDADPDLSAPNTDGREPLPSIRLPAALPSSRLARGLLRTIVAYPGISRRNALCSSLQSEGFIEPASRTTLTTYAEHIGRDPGMLARDGRARWQPTALGLDVARHYGWIK